MDEADRSLHDAIMIVRRALKSPLVVPGGGAIDMELSQALRWAGFVEAAGLGRNGGSGGRRCGAQLYAQLPPNHLTSEAVLPSNALPAGPTRAASPASRSCSSTRLRGRWRCEAGLGVVATAPAALAPAPWPQLPFAFACPGALQTAVLLPACPPPRQVIPRQLADNSGFDATDVLNK